ncbi:13109_t:CDS:2 [Dentiscutata heterogama]|uniref:13109_t:CDS:1 n=1 Tax=Dentiscutata heterogama TaxID=1316150 RepID=A0ACA9M1U9_9GLOM|nr:13109_t:CDS:2 [Dentiscutata heterogama]
MLPYQIRKCNWVSKYYIFKMINGKLLKKPYISPLLFKITHVEDKSKTEINQAAEISQIKKGLEDLTSLFDKTEVVKKLNEP